MLRTAVVLAAALAAAAPRPAEGQPATPEAAVEAYYAALAAADFAAVAALTHPRVIHRIRNDIVVQAERGPGLPAPLRRRLGGRGIEEIRAMPPAVFYRDLLTAFIPDRAAMIEAMARVSVVVSTAAYEADDLAHVVHTVTVPRPGQVVERTGTMAVALDRGAWKVIPEAVAGVHVAQTLGLPAVLVPFFPAVP
jgi:hypothetical protein